MRSSQVFSAVLLAATLAATRAWAPPGNNSWTVSGPVQAATMGVQTPLTFTITNSAGSRDTVFRFTLSFASGAYTVRSGASASGWQVRNIGSANTSIEFVAASCQTGVAPGASTTVTVDVIGASAAQDIAADTLASVAAKECTGKNFGGNPTAFPTWARRGLAVTLAATPTSLAVNREVTLTMTVTNRTTATKTGVSGTLLPFTGTATLRQAPAQPVTLVANGSVNLIWIYQVTSQGQYAFQGSAATAGTTSIAGTSNKFAVGSLTALMSLSSLKLGLDSQLDVDMTVHNNTTGTIQKVTPGTLAFAGTATRALVSSPSGNVNLAPGTSTSFRWTYTMTGTAGQTYAFTNFATSQASGNSNTDTSPQGTLVSFNLLVNPEWAISAATARSISFTLVNPTGKAVPKVAIVNNFNTSWTATEPAVWASDTSGWSKNLGRIGLVDTYTFTAPTGGELQPGSSKTFTLTFNTAPTVTDTTFYTFTVRVFEAKGGNKIIATFDRDLTAVVRIPDVQRFSVVARSGVHVLNWTNTQTAATTHDGVLVLKSPAASGPPNTAPTDGVTYTAGQVVGNATVLYADLAGSATQVYPFPLADGTSEHYRVWNHDGFDVYSAGNAPTPSGLGSAPPGGGNPIWIYTVGFAALAQPYLAPGRGVYSASNGNAFTANEVLSGDEWWRPSVTVGAIQARVEVVPLNGLESVVAGDQAGYGYAIDATNGRTRWVANGGLPLCERIQAAAVVQRRSTSRTTPTFFSTYTTDVVFFASRNSSTSNNALFALRGDSGALLWTFNSARAGGAPIDIISGQPVIDYRRDRIYLPTFNGLYAVNTLNGNLAWSLPIGAIDSSPALVRETSNSDDRLYVGTTGGTLYNIDPNTGTVRRSAPGVGAPVQAIFVTGPNLYLSTTAGQVKAMYDSGTAITQLWSVPMANPSGVVPVYSKNHLYVGASDGRLHRLQVSDGADIRQWQLTVPGGRVSTPAMDVFLGVVAVGTLDGRLHTLTVN